MASIDPSNRLVTLINTFEVNAANADRLVEMLVRATNTVMRSRDGFVYASIHKSEDGSRVVNYAQWATKAHFESMRSDPEA
jgi:hypothetical protein